MRGRAGCRTMIAQHARQHECEEQSGKRDHAEHPVPARQYLEQCYGDDRSQAQPHQRRRHLQDSNVQPDAAGFRCFRRSDNAGRDKRTFGKSYQRADHQQARKARGEAGAGDQQ